MRLTIFSLVLAFGALLVVVELLRRRRLREKYAVIWVIVSLGTAVLAIFPRVLTSAAEFVGIQTPSNLLFLISLATLFAVSMQLSGEIGLLEEQSRRLAEEIGLLRVRLDSAEPSKGMPPEHEPPPDGAKQPPP